MDAQCETAIESGGIRESSLSQKLTSRRNQLQTELADVKRAEELLARNPELKELFDVISRVRRI